MYYIIFGSIYGGKYLESKKNKPNIMKYTRIAVVKNLGGNKVFVKINFVPSPLLVVGLLCKILYT